MISKYLNKSGKSGVKAYEILPTAIRVQFINRSKWYTYSYASAYVFRWIPVQCSGDTRSLFGC